MPASSASQGPPLTEDPDGENVSLMNVCDVGHMGLTASAKVQAPLEDFLVRGAPPRKTREICSVAATELKFYGMERPETSGGRARRAATTEDIAGAQVIDLPNSFIALTATGTPATISGTGTAAYVAATPVGDGTRGAPLYYGPITGEVTVAVGRRDGDVLDDGAPVTGTPVRPAGLSDLDEPAPTPTPTATPGSGTTPAPASTSTPAPAEPAQPQAGKAKLRHPPARACRSGASGRACRSTARPAPRARARFRSRRLRPSGPSASALPGGGAAKVVVKLKGVRRKALRRGLKATVELRHAAGGRASRRTRLISRRYRAVR